MSAEVSYLDISAESGEHTTTEWRVRLRRIYNRNSRRENLAINDTLRVHTCRYQRENKTESKHYCEDECERK